MKLRNNMYILYATAAFVAFLTMAAPPVWAGRVHLVQQGETLNTIALENNLSVDRLMAANPFMESPYALFPGQVLVVPEVKPGEKHLVSPGENLESIAGDNGISPGELAAYNELEREKVFSGQVIIIPPPSKEVVKPAEKATSHVKKPVLKDSGDSLSGLAAKYPGLIAARGPGDKKVVALTFDDGPDDKYTPQVMDILDRNQVKGTFFLVGSLIEKHPGVVKNLVANGHQVAGHGWSHSNLKNLNRDHILSELNQTTLSFRNVLGLEPLMFRPPYGGLSPDVMSEASALGYTSVIWNADSLDWYSRSADSILASALVDTKRGSIILMHSAGINLDATLEALPELIYTLKAQGYTFVTVSELLGKDSYREDPGMGGLSGGPR